ncbi:MAG: DEAD/DEAH box helicase [Proteobacteria bacterium]|nr:DEAD/DEAH box helicase [Pseudomonadota bacterium]
MSHSDLIARLQKNIRKKCGVQAWTQGERLVQAGRVELLSSSAEQMEFAVHTVVSRIAPTVVLYLEDEDWECDCPASSDTCAHVVAAAIAAGTPLASRVASNDGQPDGSDAKQRLPHMEYRLQIVPKGVALQRVVVSPSGERQLLKVPLARGLEKNVFPLGFRPLRTDLAVDLAVGRVLHPTAPLPRAAIDALFENLAAGAAVFLNDAPVRMASEVLCPLVSLENHGDEDVVLRVLPNPEVEKVVAPGVVLCSGHLHRAGETGLSGLLLEKLPREVVWTHARLAHLVEKVLPAFDENTDVAIHTDRLPERTDVLHPRVRMQMENDGGTLSVVPQLVYGDPPHVRIEQDEAVYLQGSVPKRTPHAEQRLLHQVRDQLNLVIGAKSFYSGADTARFLERLQRWQRQFPEFTTGAHASTPRLFPKLRIEKDLFQLSFVRQGEAADEARAPVRTEDVLSAWRDGLSVVPLLDGGFATLPMSWLDKHGHLVSDILFSLQSDGRLTPLAALPLEELCESLQLPRPDAFDVLLPLLDAGGAIPEVPLPADFRGVLRPYQQQGVDWLRFLAGAKLGAILADDMGLGKTVQMLCALEGRTLVVCPTSVLHNWRAEAARFRPGLKCAVYHGPSRTLDPSADLVLTTYAILRLDRAVLSAASFDTVVLDEAQNIKNPASQTARAAYMLNGGFRVAMSGTPVENRLDELWSLFQFTNPGFLNTRRVFQQRFAVPIEFGDDGAAERLAQKVRPFVLRRKKTQVLPDLPLRTEATLLVPLGEHERHLYDALHAAARAEFATPTAGDTRNTLGILEALLRLRQCACHPGLLPGNPAETSAKTEALLSHLRDAAVAGHRSLVFSQWTRLLDLLEPQLTRSGISFLRLDGSTRNREAVVADFQRADGPPVMLVSLKAGGTGLNLTAADHVFIVDPWWNPAVEEQAADRAHRIGQERPVMVYRLVAEDTIEERIQLLQEKKKTLAEAAVGDGDAAFPLTREELLALLD